jgi:predicted alpha/beta superfamily hydrolase/uncharacterized cupin superfamily protein
MNSTFSNTKKLFCLPLLAISLGVFAQKHPAKDSASKAATIEPPLEVVEEEPPPPPPPVVIPNTRTINLKSRIADQEYVLHINLPGDYATEFRKAYPVIFVLDGQWDFPLVSAIYGEQYFDGFIPAAITVGITWGGTNPNYDRLRARDFTPSSPDGSDNWGHASKFLSAIQTEIIPYIDSHFRTIKTDRTLMGSSLGGLFTLYTLYTKPALFNRYVLTSPAIGWDRGSLAKYRKEYEDGDGHQVPVRLAMAVGALEPSASLIHSYAMGMESRHFDSLNLQDRVLPNTGHSGGKAEGYTRGLQFVFEKPKFDIPAASLANYTGVYADGRDSIKIERDGDHLVAFLPGNPRWVLYSWSATDFYAKGILLRLHFTPADAGTGAGANSGTNGGANGGANGMKEVEVEVYGGKRVAKKVTGLAHPASFRWSPSQQPTLPGDTLTGRVVAWDQVRLLGNSPKGDTLKMGLTGKTHDLAALAVISETISPGRSFRISSERSPADHLVIVRDGSFAFMYGAERKVLGPGGAALFAKGDDFQIINSGKSKGTFYVFSLRAYAPADSSEKAREPFMLDWPDMPVKKTDKGESRQIFDRSLYWFHRIDMHATTLNPGQISHPPHVHRAEEIIFMRGGHVKAFIDGQYYDATAGDLIFFPSGVPHNIENQSNERCEYFALQWEP